MHRTTRLSGLTAAPTLTTARLRLRMPVLADFAYRAAFYGSDRSVWEGGPISEAETWRIWASEVGQWPLFGAGPFSVERLSDGAYLGEVGIYQPLDFPEPELGWFVVPEAEGQGIALEAARAVMDWARRELGLSHLVNYIDPGNARSIALGERLGGVHRTDLPVKDAGDVVLWHDLTAQPAGIAS